MRIYKGIFFFFAVLLTSCGETKTAIIWTDRPEFALYGEYFNTVQNQYKISVKYFEFPASELEKPGHRPDIVVGSWLKNNTTASYFKSIDNIFSEKKLSRDGFYQRFLSVGRVDKNQYLLPVSFNIPALVFSREREQELSSLFTVDFDEIKTLGKNYNTEARGVYTRMGFSPLWNENFLYTTAVLSDASFMEASPLAWDSAALDRSMDFINKWTNEINTNSQAEEDFTFKYFFEPPEKLIQSGRILFSYMESDNFFLLNESSRNNLGFRWVMEKNRIPIEEDFVLLGIPKKAKSTKAARAFIHWFFQTESQRLLMEYCKTSRINENVFGICGGFSSLSSVTEQIFPLFYPELLGRMPSSEYFMPPNVMPGSWAAIKERVVLPYLVERARKETVDETYTLERRLSEWVRMNR